MVKYADGPEASVSTEVDASTRLLWALITDINLPAKFSKEFQDAEWLAPSTGPALGATFAGHNKHEAIGEWEVVCTVSDFEPDRKFGWTVNDVDDPTAYWCFSLEALANGATKLTHYARMGPGRSGLNAAIEAMPDKEEKIVAKRLGWWTTNMEATIAGIKAIAETEPAGSA